MYYSGGLINMVRRLLALMQHCGRNMGWALTTRNPHLWDVPAPAAVAALHRQQLPLRHAYTMFPPSAGRPATGLEWAQELQAG